MSIILNIAGITFAIAAILFLSWLGLWYFKKALPSEATNLPASGWLVLGHRGGAKFFHTREALIVFSRQTSKDKMEWDVYRVTNDILFYDGTTSKQR